MDDAQFEKLVDEVVEEIPQEYREKLHNVSIVVADWPTPQQMHDLKIGRGLLFGLYEGTPRTKGGHYRVKLPDKITIFKVSHLMVAKTVEDLRERVKSTVLHEIAHHFGMDEHQVRSAEHSRYTRISAEN